MVNTGKKKTKRVDSRRAMDNESAARRHRFYDSGAPLSLALLLLFVIITTLILSFDIPAATRAGLFWSGWRTLFIEGVIVGLLSFSLGLYIMAYEPRIVKNHLRGSVLAASILIMLAIIRLGVIESWNPYLLVVPVMIIGIMMTIAYTQRFALGVCALLSLLSMVSWADNAVIDFKEGLGVLLATGSGAGIAILLLRDIRSRTKLIEVCSLAGLAVFAFILVVGMWQNKDSSEMLWDSLYGGVGAVAVGFVMQGLLPIIERIFHTATNMTLLDYSEATKPLLKRLAVEAPGTFNHSWQIGMLAEAAAEAIGANGLLCRVGSYYHDVGKLNKPRYFVENQVDQVNQHKELSPTMSRMIIIGHVKDGLELLREYHIPKVLHQFVATHHGTTLVEFFYHEAAMKESEEGRTVEESEFRYPGPKPWTREAAIVMLADAVEGATRAMRDPTPSRIEAVVHELSMKRLMDGQFDNCDLTMKELHLIEQSLVKSLCAMYHGRIAYPKSEKSGKATLGEKRLTTASGNGKSRQNGASSRKLKGKDGSMQAAVPPAGESGKAKPAVAEADKVEAEKPPAGLVTRQADTAANAVEKSAAETEMQIEKTVTTPAPSGKKLSG